MAEKQQLFDYQASIPGPGRITITAADGQRYELLVNFNIAKIEDLATKDVEGRTEFGLHFSIGYSSRKLKPGEGAMTVDPMKVDW